MKNYLSFIIVGILIILQSCKPISYSSQVNFKSKENTGVYIVNAYGYAKKSKDAVLEAEKNAFKVIIFKGLPGSDLTVPLVDNESTSMSQNKTFYDNFFDGGGYRSFIMNRNDSYTPKKIRNGYQSEVTLKINLASLRRELEQNQIIRKFGY
jgi:hypothetical protein